MRPFYLAILFLSLMLPADAAHGRHDWAAATARLHTGDHLAISLATGSSNSVFQSANSAELITDSGRYQRAEVSKIERIHTGGGSRVKHALWGAAIGGGAGAGIGAGARCTQKAFGFCPSNGYAVGIFGGIGTLGGAAVGALLPAHGKRELVYSAK